MTTHLCRLPDALVPGDLQRLVSRQWSCPRLGCFLSRHNLLIRELRCCQASTADVGALGGHANLQRDLDQKSIFSAVNFEKKRPHLQHVASRQGFVFFNRLSIELDRVTKSEGEDVIVFSDVFDACLRTRYRWVVEQQV